MFVRRLKPLLISTAILAVLSTTVVAHATSAGATIKLAPDAALANPPNSIVVTVDYSCLPSQFSFGAVQIDQSQPASVASGPRNDVFGFGSFQPTCDDKMHHDSVVVTAGFGFFGGGTFVPGTAGATAFVSSGAVSAQTSSEITIK
jgi:hypothetical protein